MADAIRPKRIYSATFDDETGHIIAEYITQWGVTSMLFTFMIHELSHGRASVPGDDMIPLFPLVGMSEKLQIGILKTLVRIRLQHEANRTQCEKALDKLNNNKLEYRDMIAHSMWTRDDSRKVYVGTQLKVTSKLPTKTLEITSAKVNEYLTELLDYRQSLYHILRSEGYLQHMEAFGRAV